jgi:hypothetical protein
MNTADMTHAAGRYYALRGLLLLPTGFLLVVAGLFNLLPVGDEPVPPHAVWALPALVIALVALVLINRYYVTTFGRADPLTKTKVQITLYTVLSTVAVAIGIAVDSQADLPISAFGLLYAVFMLLYYRSIVGLSTHHWVFLGGLGLLSILPIWGGADDKTAVAMVPIGLATMGLGWFDHKELVRTLGPTRPITRACADADADT